MINLNGQSIYFNEGIVKKLAGFGGIENSWGSGKNVRFGIKVVASMQNLQNFTSMMKLTDVKKVWIH